MSPKTFSQVSELGKSSGKYLPYANVDTFLKVGFLKSGDSAAKGGFLASLYTSWRQ
jgi:hypothetical protein